MIDISNISVHKKGGKTPMNLRKLKSGFTIIEVVLVLAIAGLIFIMVFTALPALQRNQRDTDRKNEAARILAAVQSFQSDNRGALPTASNNDALAKYLDAKVVKGSIELASGRTITYASKPANEVSVKATTEGFLVYPSTKCGSTSDKVAPGTSRQVAVVIKLENGDAVYCSAN